MKARLPGKLGNSSGQSLVELALVLPLLVMLILGVVDISRAIQAHNSIVHMSREGANLASRSMLMKQDNGAQMIMDSLANTGSLSMGTNGMMYITQVDGTGGVPTIVSQIGWEGNPGGPQSEVASGSLGKILGNIQMKNGDTIWIVEVFYKYQSMFVQSYSTQLHSLAIF